MPRTSPLDLIPKASPIHRHAAWFLSNLKASRKAPGTIAIYLGAVQEYDRWAQAQDAPRALADIHREHVEGFLLDQVERWAPSTASARYFGLRAFFKWATEVGEIDRNPIDGVKAPAIPEQPVPILTEAQIKAMLATCKDRSFKARRDEALLRFLFATGARREETASIRTADIDWETGVVSILHGKGGKTRPVLLDPKTLNAFYAYQVARDEHPHASSPFWFLGERGPLGGEGIGIAFSRRARMAKVWNGTDADGNPKPAHVHQARHTWTHRFLAAGGSELDAMHLGGWNSLAMISKRYGKAGAQDRALEAARRVAVGEAF